MKASIERKSRTRPTGCINPVLNKAIAYVRVSTEEQVKQGVSLAAQIDRIKAYCLMQGLELVQVISEDGVSGGKKLVTRVGGAELSKVLKAGDAGHVVTIKLDRLFRDAEDALCQTRKWDRGGIALHIIDMGGSALNTASAMGRLFVTITAGFAEVERNLTVEKTASALQHKKEHRTAYSPTPYGFGRSGTTTIWGKGGSAQLTVDEEEAGIVASMKILRAGGMTLQEIADRLNSCEIPTKRGGVCWYAATVRRVLANSIHNNVLV